MRELILKMDEATIRNILAVRAKALYAKNADQVLARRSADYMHSSVPFYMDGSVNAAIDLKP